MSYLQQKFVEEAQISYYPMKAFKAFTEFFAICTCCIISLHRFIDKTTGVLI